jgi:hypothetical protein
VARGFVRGGRWMESLYWMVEKVCGKGYEVKSGGCLHEGRTRTAGRSGLRANDPRLRGRCLAARGQYQ